VEDHALVAELDEGFREGEGLERKKTMVVSCGLLLSVSSAGEGGSGESREKIEHTRGRRRVPKPPTRMRAGGGVSDEVEWKELGPTDPSWWKMWEKWERFAVEIEVEVEGESSESWFVKQSVEGRRMDRRMD
jgi:hypothetical protein